MSESGPCVLAVDIGGTSMRAAVIALDGALRAQAQIPTTEGRDGDDLFARLAGLCRGVVEASGGPVAAIGVGCAGPMVYPAGEVSPLNVPHWRGFPLRERLQAAFGLPTIVDNDAKAVAVGEHWLGAGRDERHLVGMVVSTGVGGGIILDGRLLHGARGNAGHIGHVVVWPDGPLCRCGARGCVEAVASGTGLAQRLAVALAAGEATVLPAGADAAAIAEAARGGDSLARRLFEDAGTAVGRGIASATALLDLDVAVVGGSIALKAWDLLGPPLEAALRRDARIAFARDIRVRQAALGDAAGLFGASALAFDLVDAR